MSIAQRSMACRSAALALLGLLAATLAEAQLWTVRSRWLTVPDENQFGSAVAIGDLDGDGFDELVVGERYWHFPPNPGYNGRVHFYRGGANGALAPVAAFHSTEETNYVGWSIALGDFDGDADLEAAVGVPGVDQANGLYQRVGGVWLYDWQAETVVGIGTLVPVDFGDEGSHGDERFGQALATGDFDADGYDDLAIGAPYRELETVTNAGRVYVRYGSAEGLTAAGQQSFVADDVRAGTSTAYSVFGLALAAGDFDGDGFDDLAIGAAARTVEGVWGAGQVHVVYGSAAGLSMEGDQLLDERDAGQLLESEDSFGAALAAGDFDAAGCDPEPGCADDLAVGVPYQDLPDGAEPTQVWAGAVRVFYGSVAEGGLDPASAQSILQDDLAATTAFDENLFGSVLVAGRLAGGPGDSVADDLVIGVPDEHNGYWDSGVAHLLFGGSGGLDPQRSLFLRPEPGLGSYPPYQQQLFGYSAALGDLDGDGWGDLALGAAGRDTESGVQLLFGALFADGFESGWTCEWDEPLCL